MNYRTYNKKKAISMTAGMQRFTMTKKKMPSGKYAYFVKGK